DAEHRRVQRVPEVTLVSWELVAPRPPDQSDNERQTSERRHEEPRHDETFRAFLRAGALHRPRIGVLLDLDTVEARAQFNQLVPVHIGQLFLGGLSRSMVTARVLLLIAGHLSYALDPIHRVALTRTPMPTTHATTPSEAGPKPPNERPPPPSSPAATDLT